MYFIIENQLTELCYIQVMDGCTRRNEMHNGFYQQKRASSPRSLSPSELYMFICLGLQPYTFIFLWNLMKSQLLL